MTTDLDLLGTDADRAYTLLASLVTPRPIAWVTTLNQDGSVNAAPFSFFNVFGDDPPLVIFAPGDRENGTPKDTALNCRRSGEFVVNLLDEPLAAAMVATSAPLPYGTSETTAGNIETSPSLSIAPPRITQAPAALECRVHSIQEIGNNRIVLGIVHHLRLHPSLYDPTTRRIIQSNFHPIGRMATPDWYCKTTSRFEIPRPH